MLNKTLRFSIVDVRSCVEFIPVVARWHHDLWAHLNPGQSLTDRIKKMQIYRMASIAGQFSPTMYIALDSEGNPIGTAALDAHDMDCLPDLTPWLASVFVLPRYRNHGVASALINRVCGVAFNDMAIDTLYLFTPGQSSFYRRLGWVYKCNLDYYGENVDVMQFGLSP